MYSDILKKLGYSFKAITLSIDEVNINHSYYPRVSVDDETVERYANSLSLGEQFPPVVVDRDNVLIDGYHRFLAFKETDRGEIEALQILDELTDDERFSLAVELNLRHGKSFTDSDYEKIKIKGSYKVYRHISELFKKYVLIQTATELSEEIFKFSSVVEEPDEEKEISPLEKVSSILDKEESDFIDSLTSSLTPEPEEEVTEKQVSEEVHEKVKEEPVRARVNGNGEKSVISEFSFTEEVEEEEEEKEKEKAKETWVDVRSLEEDILRDANFYEESEINESYIKDVKSLKKESEDEIRKFMEQFHKVEGMLIKLGKKAVEFNVPASVFESAWTFLLGHLLSMFRDFYLHYQIDQDSTLKVMLGFYQTLKDAGFSQENLNVIQGVANSVRTAR